MEVKYLTTIIPTFESLVQVGCYEVKVSLSYSVILFQKEIKPLMLGWKPARDKTAYKEMHSNSTHSRPLHIPWDECLIIMKWNYKATRKNAS